MKKIEEHLALGQSVVVNKNVFVNEELRPRVNTSYRCCNCGSENEIIIIPYQTGFAFSELHKKKFLLKEDILMHKLASPSSRMSSHLGDFLVSDLPTLYFKTTCKNCQTKFLVVFGYGEKQPGKWMCVISGIWEINYL